MDRTVAPVNFFAFRARHTLLPRQNGFPVARLRLQLAAPAVPMSGRLGRHEQFHTLFVRLLNVHQAQVTAIQ